MTEFEINYFGMDGRYHCETHTGDAVSLSQTVTFLEERGAYSITVYQHAEESTIN